MVQLGVTTLDELKATRKYGYSQQINLFAFDQVGDSTAQCGWKLCQHKWPVNGAAKAFPPSHHHPASAMPLHWPVPENRKRPQRKDNSRQVSGFKENCAEKQLHYRMAAGQPQKYKTE